MEAEVSKPRQGAGASQTHWGGAQRCQGCSRQRKLKGVEEKRRPLLSCTGSQLILNLLLQPCLTLLFCLCNDWQPIQAGKYHCKQPQMYMAPVGIHASEGSSLSPVLNSSSEMILCFNHKMHSVVTISSKENRIIHKLGPKKGVHTLSCAIAW